MGPELIAILAKSKKEANELVAQLIMSYVIRSSPESRTKTGLIMKNESCFCASLIYK